MRRRLCLCLLAALATLVVAACSALADDGEDGVPAGGGGAGRSGAGLCGAPQPGVHCGPGNNRRTSGGHGKVSHAGWPAVSGVLWIADAAGRTGTGTDLNDEMLGGHGDDTLHGGAGADILWGDQHPTGNDAWQHDVLDGGDGPDWIYTSHGTNTVTGGAGNDQIWAYYGHGTIDCGPGRDTAHVRMNGAYRLRNCERVLHF